MFTYVRTGRSSGVIFSLDYGFWLDLLSFFSVSTVNVRRDPRADDTGPVELAADWN
jgi:hypothetical protein